MGQTTFLVFLFLLITSFFVTAIVCFTEQPQKRSEKDVEEESEWRLLGKDEQVPRGSHVQLDLTTGERKIKKINSDKKDKEKETSVMQLSTEESGSNENLNFRLRHIVGDDPGPSGNSDKEKKNALKHKFRSYEELKKDFEDLRMAVKTDIEIMNGILKSYKELLDDKMPVTTEIQEQQINMLADLEYLLHQIDNANEFVKNGGLANVILPSLNSSSSEIRSGTARVLGSAAQSNVAVQILALESGAIGILLRILALDKTPSVRSSAMYALSCLVRRFPIAQKKLVDEGGLTVLNNLFNGDGPDKLKIQIKVLSLIHDLIVEKQDAEKAFTLISKDTNSNASATSINEARERLKQYNLISLETRLQEQHWCTQLSSLLIGHVSLYLDSIVADIHSKSDSISEEINIEHDVIEKIIKAMASSSNLCLSDYESNRQLKEIVSVLQLWYKRLLRLDDDNDSYFKYMSQMLDEFSWKYKIQLKGNLKDEL